MKGARILVIILGIGFCLGTEEPQTSRTTRTIARFFGLDSNPQPQPQQHQLQPVVQQPQTVSPPQVRKPVPLVYSVKYYDRTGEGEKVDVIPEHAIIQDSRIQGVPARVFLNLYTGQQTPVYYDNKGQLLVPCPVYDHLYVAGVDQSLIRKPSPPKLIPSPMHPVPPPVSVAQVQPVAPEIVYYATPSYVGQNPVHPKPGGLTVVGLPYDYPYYPGVYPSYGPGGYNPYLFIKPNTGHPHHHPPPVTNGQIQQPVVPQAVEKKEGEKTD